MAIELTYTTSFRISASVWTEMGGVKIAAITCGRGNRRWSDKKDLAKHQTPKTEKTHL